MSDEHLPMKSLSFFQRRGLLSTFRVPSGSLWGVLGVRVNDQINGGRGAIWDDVMKILRARLFFRKCGTLVVESSLESVLEQRDDLFIVHSQPVHAEDIETTRTIRSAKLDVCATPFVIDGHLSTSQQGNWLAEQTQLHRQLGHARQCVKSPTVGQIRRENRWVRRARQFADLRLTFLGIRPKDLRFVVHTDYPLKDQDGTGRAQNNCCDQIHDECGSSGSVEEVAEAETSSHVNFGQVKPWH